MKWLRRVLKSAEYKTEFGEQKENKLSVWRSDELNTKPLKYNSKKVEEYKTIWKRTSYTRETLPELCQVGLSAMFICLNTVNEGLLAKAHGKDLAKCVCWMLGEKQTHSAKKKTSDVWVQQNVCELTVLLITDHLLSQQAAQLDESQLDESQLDESQLDETNCSQSDFEGRSVQQQSISSTCWTHHDSL